MAFYYELAAISCDNNTGKYEFINQTNCEFLKIEKSLLNNISISTLYFDGALVITRNSLTQFIPDFDEKTLDWCKSLSNEVSLIMIICKEWESGN
jgi:hypothetical protein